MAVEHADSNPLPLSGLRVLVTRAAGRADQLAERLRALGAIPLVHPTIAYAPPEDPTALVEALDRLEAGMYDWILFTSATAVEMVVQALGERAPLLSRRASFKIGAVGPATAAVCRELLGIEPAAMPERFIGEQLATAIGDPAGQRILLPNAEIARPELEERLRAAGAVVDRVVAYRTVPAPGGETLNAWLHAGTIDVLLFTSGSTARYFALQAGESGLEAARRCVVACIGPSTAAACRELGLTPAVVASVSTEEGLVEALVAYYARREGVTER